MSIMVTPITLALRLLILAAIALRTIKDKSLTNSGIKIAVVTGLVHSLPQSWIYLTLLMEFFILGNKATKYKHWQKARLTESVVNLDKSGTSSNNESRNHVQVLANSLASSVSIILYLIFRNVEIYERLCQIGVIVHYCSVTADTWSSEIGILSQANPILLSVNPKTMFKTVPRGTNGGVSKLGLSAAIAGSFIIGLSASTIFLSFPTIFSFLGHLLFFTISGFVGSLVDSLLGSYLQASYVDSENSKIVEVYGGYRMGSVAKSKKFEIVNGSDILDNNQVNLLMSLMTSCTFVFIYYFLFI